ncbi:glycosyl/glycerophosphate transferase, teichoic acid biosynthesis [Rheinheimera sp. A13L]|uniref:CDP-glycerol glycerophosphotransferase family protein n=1 Tax=Rheinheimera sp. A13L TaxID=506534 RepID=UPI00021255D6|nr:CDP-glycerol glycerophosphotransferase family protein [Rheinheimera sp. A13L]EGM78224.1 glycosyl/glycerophosphate transferase, teichoic acid biosynthesis [Rheinheimera sp. A13L]
MSAPREAKDWQGQRLYIAPDNPAGRNLALLLQQQGAIVLGIVDNLKQGPDVCNHASQSKAYDAVLIAPSDFQQKIAEGMLQNGFVAKKIWCCKTLNPFQFEPYKAGSVWQKLKVIIHDCFLSLQDLLPKGHVVYYAEKYVDSNVLVAFDAHQKRHQDVYLVVKDAQRCFHPAQIDKPLQVCWLLQRAKVLVLDHESTDPLFNRIRTQAKVVQLWHGLPFKHLAGNKHFAHILDEAFVSSSSWFNLHVFPKMFKAKHYLDFGYPRNDALLQAPLDRCWHNSLSQEQLQQLRAGKKLIVFMPTYRDNGQNDHPINWPELQQFLVEHNAVFVMKTHPFLAPFDELRQQEGCDRIFHYPGRFNVYPWLADADLLITDYSSVAFDFLLCNKPVLHFMYDIEQYAKVRGQFAIAKEDFIAGRTAETFAQLLEQMALDLETDRFALKRQALQQKFDMVSTSCCPALIAYLEQLKLQP